MATLWLPCWSLSGKLWMPEDQLTPGQGLAAWDPQRRHRTAWGLQGPAPLHCPPWIPQGQGRGSPGGALTGHEGTKVGGAPCTCTCPASARPEPGDGAPPMGTGDSHTSEALARGPAPPPPPPRQQCLGSHLHPADADPPPAQGHSRHRGAVGLWGGADAPRTTPRMIPTEPVSGPHAQAPPPDSAPCFRPSGTYCPLWARGQAENETSSLGGLASGPGWEGRG